MTSPPVAAARPGAGARDMLLASFGFAWMGLFVKQVAATVPIAQVVAWRTLLTALVVLAVATARGTSLRPRNPTMQVVRALVGLASMSSYFFAISRLPLGDAVLLTYLSPILVALISPYTTGERVDRRVWGALLLGLVGVALVARPGGTTDWLGLGAALVAACFAAAAYVSVKVLTRTDPPDVIVFWFSVVGGAVSLASFLPGIVLPDVTTAVLLVLMGVIGAGAQHFMTRAYASADAAVVSVFSYATPVFAYALGLLFRGEVPAPGSVAGTALVVTAGILVARRDAVTAPRPE